MPNLGVQELGLILLICLFLFGPGKLPQVGRALGETLRSFKAAAEDGLIDSE